ncbi:SGNH hydrolase [Pseudonocardiaceae bacterium YIM PH 21723]|nr:SGNH hydrolase [Pseudonocardiaceae bacterium YIM PH 21723]
MALFATMSMTAGVSPATAGPEQWKIMPLGDSITHGDGSSTQSSYRADLWRILYPTHPGLDFVGSQQSGQLPDTDHEGHGGWMIDDLRAKTIGWIVAFQPRTILLHIGTNDMDRGPEPEQAPQRLGALLDDIEKAVPGTQVFVATLVPSKKAAVQERIDRFNAAVPGVVAGRAHVSLVRMDGLDPDLDLRDDLHPNDRGYGKMASLWGAALGG